MSADRVRLRWEGTEVGEFNLAPASSEPHSVEEHSPLHENLLSSSTEWRSSTERGASRSSTERHYFPSATAILDFARAHDYSLGRELTEWQLFPWGNRLEVEMGRADPVVVHAPKLPDDVRPVVRDYFNGFVYLFACRRLTDPSESVTFSHDFAACWVWGDNTRTWDAHEARAECKRLGLIVETGEMSGRAKHWKLGDA